MNDVVDNVPYLILQSRAKVLAHEITLIERYQDNVWPQLDDVGKVGWRDHLTFKVLEMNAVEKILKDME